MIDMPCALEKYDSKSFDLCQSSNNLSLLNIQYECPILRRRGGNTMNVGGGPA